MLLLWCSPDPVPPAILWKIITPRKQEHSSAILRTASLTFSTNSWSHPLLFGVLPLYPKAQLLPLPGLSVTKTSGKSLCGETLCPKHEWAGLGSLSTTTHGKTSSHTASGIVEVLLLFLISCDLRVVPAVAWANSSIVSQNDRPSCTPHWPTWRKTPLAIITVSARRATAKCTTQQWAVTSLEARERACIRIRSIPKIHAHFQVFRWGVSTLDPDNGEAGSSG